MNPDDSEGSWETISQLAESIRTLDEVKILAANLERERKDKVKQILDKVNDLVRPICFNFTDFCCRTSNGELTFHQGLWRSGYMHEARNPENYITLEILQGAFLPWLKDELVRVQKKYQEEADLAEQRIDGHRDQIARLTTILEGLEGEKPVQEAEEFEKVSYSTVP